MKRSFIIAILFTLLLFALLLIPLDGKVDNTFLFFLGRFHPIILHLPIGALMVLLLMEIINKFRPKLNLDAACKILLWFSVLSIIPTITLGFLLASSGSYDDEIITIKSMHLYEVKKKYFYHYLQQKIFSRIFNFVTKNIKKIMFQGKVILSRFN